jgi:hypothetical protein
MPQTRPAAKEILYCTVCDVNLCLVCKATSHDGHVIEDLVDTASKARQELSDALNTWQEQFRQLEVEQEEADKTRKLLEAQMNSADEQAKKRASDVV